MNSVLRTMVRSAYDLQKLRIQMGNRIVMNFRIKLGQAPSTKEEDMDEEGKEILERIRKSYKLMMDGVKVFPKRKDFKADGVISTYTELCLLVQYIEIEKSEKSHFGRLEGVLEEYAVYNEWIVNIRGIGPAMAGVIVSEFDIAKSRTVSAMWKYAGLAVMDDGLGQSKRKEHLVDVEYKAKNGEAKTKKSITYNPFLKTKLIGVLAASFLRAGDNPYSKIYRDYKHRLENNPKYLEVKDPVENNPKYLEVKDPVENKGRKGHRHAMALRYMIKMFLLDLYTNWRRIEGLPVTVPYHEGKLGMKHGVDAKKEEDDPLNALLRQADDNMLPADEDAT